MAKSTVARRLATLRSFFKYLYQEGYIKINHAKLVPSPKAPKHLPDFLDVDDAFGLVRAPEEIGLCRCGTGPSWSSFIQAASG